MILFISYDLKNPNKNYEPFYNTLKEQGVWWHYLKSTWLLDTNKTPDQVYEALRHHIEQADRILVGTMVGPKQGWLEKEAWDWINARLGR